MSQVVRITLDEKLKIVLKDEITGEIVDYKSLDAGRKKAIRSIGAMLKDSPNSYYRLQLYA